MIAKPISAFCFGIALISSLEGSVAPLLMLTQSEVRIPSDAQLERLEREGIATPTLDVSGAPAMKGTEESQDQQMALRTLTARSDQDESISRSRLRWPR